MRLVFFQPAYVQRFTEIPNSHKLFFLETSARKCDSRASSIFKNGSGFLFDKKTAFDPTTSGLVTHWIQER